MSCSSNNALKYDFSCEDFPVSPERLLQVFEEIGVKNTLFHHKPMFTVADGEDIKESIPGTHCRNLFIRDRKEKMFLVVAPNETPVDMKKLQELLDCGRLSFGSPERLWKYLGVKPGSVCPFAVINDHDKKVNVILDRDMMNADLLNYHPLDNSMTVSISPDDLKKFLRFTDHDFEILDLGLVAPDIR